MFLLFMKLVGAPLFLVAATLAARRWGGTVGGLIVALPLISGPISVFLALEDGAEFAVRAGIGSLTGTLALAFFGFVYAVVCPKGRIFAVVAGLSAFAVSSVFLSRLNLSLVTLFTLTAFCIVLLGYMTPVSRQVGPARRPLKYDLLLRVCLMVAMTFAVTEAAPFLGPTASGVLSSLPLMALTMALFAQRDGKNAAEAQKVMKGLVSGLTSTAVFYLVLPTVLTDEHLIFGYGTASLAAVLLQCAVLFVIQGKRRKVLRKTRP